MNVGCIPSKALLQIARYRHAHADLASFGLGPAPAPEVRDPFRRIQEHLDYISEKKTRGMFDKVELFLQQGAAEFVDANRVRVGDRVIGAKRIFIAAGTRPAILPVPGIADIRPLTNETIFSLDKVPERLIVLGGGAIACEMAQAFQRLGSQVTMVQRSAHLLSSADPAAAAILEERLRAEGVRLLTGHQPARIEKRGAALVLLTDKGEQVVGDELLAATGRLLDYRALLLDKAGVAVGGKGEIAVNRYLQTSRGHIYAVGDCNGHHLFSHAAMHQGMVALMNGMSPWPFKQDFRKFVVPSTVFTEPQISHVGRHARDLDKQGIKYETIEARYGDYGAAIAENLGVGFVRAYVSPRGRIYGADIVGEGSGEMINEWALAVQKRIRIHDIMMLQHSFPTMGFMSKRIGEIWMMGKMKSPTLRRLAQIAFRIP
jgi:pyruvate/2-oxoglutarate dehydrogenase complex dihydrolipoamide dehydrogenase (E3) component